MIDHSFTPKPSYKVLILCTGNSCRSIIAQALINAELEGISAQSAGVKATGKVHPLAKIVLEEAGIWQESYHSKTLESLRDNQYDLIVTVCNHAKESCPIFPYPTPTLHCGFEDPDGLGIADFKSTLKEIRRILLPQVQTTLS
ncbi:MAG: arsenate reductase ArsC [Sulfurovum sp.]|nr:arsenate reductase ArsC [Sulfurovum sp.]